MPQRYADAGFFVEGAVQYDEFGNRMYVSRRFRTVYCDGAVYVNVPVCEDVEDVYFESSEPTAFERYGRSVSKRSVRQSKKGVVKEPQFERDCGERYSVYVPEWIVFETLCEEAKRPKRKRGIKKMRQRQRSRNRRRIFGGVVSVLQCRFRYKMHAFVLRNLRHAMVTCIEHEPGEEFVRPMLDPVTVQAAERLLLGQPIGYYKNTYDAVYMYLKTSPLMQHQLLAVDMDDYARGYGFIDFSEGHACGAIGCGYAATSRHLKFLRSCENLGIQIKEMFKLPEITAEMICDYCDLAYLVKQLLPRHAWCFLRCSPLEFQSEEYKVKEERRKQLKRDARAKVRKAKAEKAKMEKKLLRAQKKLERLDLHALEYDLDSSTQSDDSAYEAVMRKIRAHEASKPNLQAEVEEIIDSNPMFSDYNSWGKPRWKSWKARFIDAVITIQCSEINAASEFEIWATFLANLSMCSTYAHMATTILSFTQLKFGFSLAGAVHKVVIKIIETIDPQSEDFQETIKGLPGRWKNLVSGPFAQKIKKLIALLVVAGVLSHTSVPFEAKGFEDFFDKSGVKNIHGVDLVTHILDVFSFICDKGYTLIKTRDITSLWRGGSDVQEYEREFTFIVSKAPLVEAGQVDKLGIDDCAYETRLLNLYDKTLSMIGLTSGFEQKVLKDKLLMLAKLQTKVAEWQQNLSLREAPFSFLLYGPSSIGKTTMIDPIMNALSRSLGLDPDPSNSVTLNASDKFQSEYQSRHHTVIIDDIANTVATHTEIAPTQLIVNFCNNNPTRALKAEAELKGKVVIRPKIVIGTTNTKGIEAAVYSNEPMSIIRRFAYTITVSVKPEFRLEGRNVLDKAKMVNVINDAWFFTVETPYQGPSPGPGIKGNVLYKVCEFNGGRMENIGLHELIMFLQTNAKVHFEQQKHLVECAKRIHTVELCPHGSYQEICGECNLATQALRVPEFVLRELASYRRWWYDLANFVPDRYAYNFFSNALYTSMLYTQVPSGARGIARRTIAEVGAFSVVVFYFWNLLASFAAFSFFTPIFLAIRVKRYFDSFTPAAQQLPWPQVVDHMKSVKWKQHLGVLGGCLMVWTMLCKLRGYMRKSEPKEPDLHPPPVFGHPKHLESYPEFENQGSMAQVPSPDLVQKSNVWLKPYVLPQQVSMEVKTATLDQVSDYICRALGHAEFIDSSRGKGNRCDIFPLQGCFWIAPYHVCRQNWDLVRVTRVQPGLIGPNFVSKMSPLNVKQIGETDLCLLYLSGGGTLKDLTPWFPLNRINDRVPARLIYKDSSGACMRDEFNASPRKWVSPSGEVDALEYHLTWEGGTFSGLCMAPLISMGRSPAILGLHIAGSSGRSLGLAHQISQDELRSCVREFSDTRTNIVFQCASIDDVRLDEPSLGVVVKREPHLKSPVCYLEEGTLNYFGSHNKRRHFKSSVVSTCISEQISREFAPCHVGPPKNIGNYKPWWAFVSTVVRPCELHTGFLTEAYKDLQDHLQEYLNENPQYKESIHPLDDVSVLAGADGVYGIDAVVLSTSCGWPINLPKSCFIVPGEKSETHERPLVMSADMWADVYADEAKLARGVRPMFVFRANLKDEPTKLTKDKVRVFAGCPLNMLILVRKYFLPLSKFFVEHRFLTECAVGLNCVGDEWTQLAEHITRFGGDRMIAGDYKAFDNKMSSQVTLAGMKILIGIAEWAGYSERQLIIMRGLATEICCPMYEVNGDFMMVSGSGPSGHPMTVILNNVVNSLYMRYAYYISQWAVSRDMGIGDALDILPREPIIVCDRFANVVSLMCYGDDNVMSVSESVKGFDHTIISAILGRSGVEYTMADKASESVPFISLEDVSFLKRRFVYSDLYKCFMAPLEMSSILKSLHCVKKSKVISLREQTAEVIENSIFEFFLHGPDVFHEARRKMEEIVKETGMVAYLRDGRLATYEECEQRFLGSVKSPVVSGR